MADPMSPAIVYVDSVRAVETSIARYPEALRVTDNPMLAHDPALPAVVADASRHLPQHEATRLGHLCVDTFLELDRNFHAERVGQRYAGVDVRLNLTTTMRSLLTTLVQRGLMLRRSLANEPGTLKLLAVDQPRWEPRFPWTLPRFVCPHRVLAEHGFFGDRQVSFEPVRVDLPNDTPDLVLQDLPLRMAVVPLAMLFHQAIGRFSEYLAWRRGVVVGRSPESVREALPWLALRGFQLPQFIMPGYASVAAPDFGEVVPLDPWVAERARPIITRGLVRMGCFDTAGVEALVTIVLQHLGAGLHCLAKTRDMVGNSLEQAFEQGSGPRTLLTGGHYGPIAGVLHAECRARGIMIVDVEHGATTGLSHSTERRISTTEVTTCDVLLAASDASARSFANGTSHGAPRIHVTGLADQTRRLFWPRVQRYRARRMLGLTRREVAVMHVSTMVLGGNLRPGDDAPVESFILETDRRLLVEAYGRIDKTVLFKSYPTHRFPHVTDYDRLFTVPSNIRFVDWADFRYFRAAADVIVTTANSSTIGWCVGARAPIVHLGSRNTLTLVDDDLRRRFAEAFLYVDLDEDGWDQRLVSLLQQPLDALLRVWRDKADARDCLVRDFIAGPPGATGRRIAAITAAEHWSGRNPNMRENAPCGSAAM